MIQLWERKLTPRDIVLELDVTFRIPLDACREREAEEEKQWVRAARSLKSVALRRPPTKNGTGKRPDD